MFRIKFSYIDETGKVEYTDRDHVSLEFLIIMALTRLSLCGIKISPDMGKEIKKIVETDSVFRYTNIRNTEEVKDVISFQITKEQD